MIELKFATEPAKITKIELKSKVDGEQKKSSLNLIVEMNVPAGRLDPLDPDLKKVFFTQSQDLAETGWNRFPAMGEVHWEGEMSGATFSIHTGIGDPVAFPDAKLDNFRFLALDGSMFRLRYHIAVFHNDDQVARICNLVNTETNVSLEPMKIAEQPVL